MKRVFTFCVAAAASASIAMPALAQKTPGENNEARPAANPNEVPPGILIAMQNAFPKVGHGDDVPRGNGKGWGHLIHDHEETPVSP